MAEVDAAEVDAEQPQHFWAGVHTRIIFYSKNRNKQISLHKSKEDTSSTSSGLRVKHVPFSLRRNLQKEDSDTVSLCSYSMIEATTERDRCSVLMTRAQQQVHLMVL